jgi:hypothetical protein
MSWEYDCKRVSIDWLSFENNYNFPNIEGEYKRYKCLTVQYTKIIYYKNIIDIFINMNLICIFCCHTPLIIIVFTRGEDIIGQKSQFTSTLGLQLPWVYILAWDQKITFSLY